VTAAKAWRVPRGRNLATPDDVVLIREADYCYGLGDLRLRLTVVGDGKPVHESAEWVQVGGVELRQDDTEIGPRSALVRVSALVARPPASAGE
jgi:hypothetical protein